MSQRHSMICRARAAAPRAQRPLGSDISDKIAAFKNIKAISTSRPNSQSQKRKCRYAIHRMDHSPDEFTKILAITPTIDPHC